MSKRYFTCITDNSVDGRFLSDFGTSYHRDEIGRLYQVKLQLNINRKYSGRKKTGSTLDQSDPLIETPFLGELGRQFWIARRRIANGLPAFRIDRRLSDLL